MIERLARLEHSYTTIRSELLKESEKTERFATLAGQLQERLSDIPLPDVMDRMGYRGEQVGEGIVYRDVQLRVALSIRGREVSDAEGRVVCRNSIDLVCHMRNEHEQEDRQERDFTQGEAFTWLAHNFGVQRAVAAYLVEREQAITVASGLRGQEQHRIERRPEQERNSPAEQTRSSFDR